MCARSVTNEVHCFHDADFSKFSRNVLLICSLVNFVLKQNSAIVLFSFDFFLVYNQLMLLCTSYRYM